MTAKPKRERLYRIDDIMQEYNLTRRQVVRRCAARGVKLRQDPEVERRCLTMIAESDLPDIVRKPR